MRGCADYLDKEQPKEYIHPQFIQKLQSQFNSLKEGDKKVILKMLGQEEGANGAERKKLFRKGVLKREKTYQEILDSINNLKGK